MKFFVVIPLMLLIFANTCVRSEKELEITSSADVATETALNYDEHHLSIVSDRNCSRSESTSIQLSIRNNPYSNWVIPKSSREALILMCSYGLTAALTLTPYVTKLFVESSVYLVTRAFTGITALVNSSIS
ncbi:uncharacterized protein LOC141900510 [Tubulanus polymorphus]|uniref:uncharacterized protein LOC141900510 n=1 Tax=Tubulanus polymorphus TaxID=672921 RepID=UPI003DA6AACA